jgi:NAD(P)-dependent dehydrogenase (short-subunit alcohol dehydrogenase family)
VREPQIPQQIGPRCCPHRVDAHRGSKWLANGVPEAQVEAERGAVGVLVNNAGHGGGGPVEEVPLSLVRETPDTNVFGLIRMCQLALPCMRAQRSGLIVNLGSAAGLVLVEPGAVRTRFLANSELHAPEDDGAGPYAVFKANVGKMTARAHRDGDRGVLDPGDLAKVIVKAVTDRARMPVTRWAPRPASPRWHGASWAIAGGTRSCAAWCPSPRRSDPRGSGCARTGQARPLPPR